MVYCSSSALDFLNKALNEVSRNIKIHQEIYDSPRNLRLLKKYDLPTNKQIQQEIRFTNKQIQQEIYD